MHELSVAASILEQVEQKLPQLEKVCKIVIELGSLSGVDERSLQSAYRQLIKSTSYSDSKLLIKKVPAYAYCGKCEQEFHAEGEYLFKCPGCGEISTQLLRGQELFISHIELCNQE